MSISSFMPVFSIDPLSPAYRAQLIEEALWQPACPVSLDRLSDVTVSYYDFEEQLHNDGHLIVLDAVAKSILQIFRRLYVMKFPIAKIRPISDYRGDDTVSMQDNNSSSFNYRSTAGGAARSLLSIHAYGLAIDINPLQNPYIKLDPHEKGRLDVLPVESRSYINRHQLRPGMVESVTTIFQRHGLSAWGGDWNAPIDYQHFQTSRFVAEMLAHMRAHDAKKFFTITMNYPAVIAKFQTEHTPMISALYDDHPEGFNSIFQSQLPYANMHSIQNFAEHLHSKLAVKGAECGLLEAY